MADTTKSKEGSGKGPSFLFGLIPFGIMLSLIIGFVALTSIAGADPVNAFIKRYYEECRKSWCATPSMIPELFDGGETRQQVQGRLARAGFTAAGDRFTRPNADTVFSRL